HMSAQSRDTDDGPLQQAEVDRLLTGGIAVATAAAGQAVLPKGLSGTSLELVSRALAAEAGGDPGASDHSASEIAEAVGMSRVSARRYLEYLVASGRAEVAPRYGTTGRPENRYRTRVRA